MKRFAALAVLAALVGSSLAGCIVVPPGGHPHHERDDRGDYH